jgi:hypothetical protein
VSKIGHWSKALPNDGVLSPTTSGKAHAILSSEERSTVNCKPNAEALLEIAPERLLKMLAATE